MNNHSTRSTAIMRFAAIITAAAALSAGAIVVGSAQAAEPTAQTIASTSQSSMEIHELMSRLPVGLADTLSSISAEENLSEQEQIEVLHLLLDDSETEMPQTRGKVALVAKALKVVAKIYKGAKWLNKLTGFLDNASNWSKSKIKNFLISLGVSSSTAENVANLVIGILL